MGPGWDCGGQVDWGTAKYLPAKVSSSLLGCVRTSLAGQGWWGLLLCPAPGRHPQCWGPQYREDGHLLDRVHWGTTRNIKQLDRWTCVEGLSAGTVQPAAENAQGDLTRVNNYLMGRSWGDGTRLFSVVLGDRTQGNGHKWKYKKLHLRKKNFTLRVTEPWDWLPRETVESPSSEILKTHVDAVLSDLLWLTSPWRTGWMSQSLEVPSSFIHSLTLGLLSLKSGKVVRVWGCWECAETLRAQYRTNTNKGERSSWSSLSMLPIRTYTED